MAVRTKGSLLFLAWTLLALIAIAGLLLDLFGERKISCAIASSLEGRRGRDSYADLKEHPIRLLHNATGAAPAKHASGRQPRRSLE
jgi:hypothetical protein